MRRLTLTADAVGPVARGHPWVYPDGLDDRATPGEPVQLADEKGRLVGFGLADEGPIAVRVLGRHAEPLAPLLARRVAAAYALRPALVPPDTDAWRVVNGAGDGLPGLVVDRYADLAVVQVHARCWEPHLEAVADAVAALGWARTVFRRFGVQRVDGREGGQVLRGPEPAETVVVREAGLRFLVRPRTGQKTGLFLDQREHRVLVGRLARDREVVNLFGYTGGFSVHAARGGARRVVTVDVAAAALEDARENFRLNDLDPARHAFECADAFHWHPDAPVGLVVCDPPSLARQRKADAAARHAYRDLAAASGAMVAPGGLLATASCTARISRDQWEQAVRDGLRRTGRWAWLCHSAEPPDHPVALAHPEGRYLKFALARRS